MMKQVELSNGIAADGMPVSAQVQHLAAKTILEIAAPIVDQNVNIKIGQSDEAKSAQEKMLNEMKTLAKNQQELLKAGHSIEDVQKLNLKIEIEEDDGEAEYAEIIEEDDEGK
jgi:oligoribonuclease (3'-5' exoribonuclease)